MEAGQEPYAARYAVAAERLDAMRRGLRTVLRLRRLDVDNVDSPGTRRYAAAAALSLATARRILATSLLGSTGLTGALTIVMGFFGAGKSTYAASLAYAAAALEHVPKRAETLSDALSTVSEGDLAYVDDLVVTDPANVRRVMELWDEQGLLPAVVIDEAGINASMYAIWGGEARGVAAWRALIVLMKEMTPVALATAPEDEDVIRSIRKKARMRLVLRRTPRRLEAYLYAVAMTRTGSLVEYPATHDIAPPNLLVMPSELWAKHLAQRDALRRRMLSRAVEENWGEPGT